MVTEGEVILVGDTGEQTRRPGRVSYEVLCRQHHRRGLIVGRAGGGPVGERPLPFDLSATDEHAT
jgi:thymidine kinase